MLFNLPIDTLEVEMQIRLGFEPVQVEHTGQVGGDEAHAGEHYLTLDKRFHVFVTVAGSNHGAVTVEDHVGSALRDSFGKPVSRVIRCGGLAGAKVLIQRAIMEG